MKGKAAENGESYPPSYTTAASSGGAYPNTHVATSSPPAPIYIGPQQMGPNSSNITCPSCHANIMTRVETSASNKTHLIALLLCVLGCWCCCCIPYCVDSCLRANHYCPACNRFIGSYDN